MLLHKNEKYAFQNINNFIVDNLLVLLDIFLVDLISFFIIELQVAQKLDIVEHVMAHSVHQEKESPETPSNN
jgi:hypothetical protein